MKVEEFTEFGVDKLAMLNFSFPNRTQEVKPADLLSGNLQLDDKEQVEATCSKGYYKWYDVGAFKFYFQIPIFSHLTGKRPDTLYA